VTQVAERVRKLRAHLGLSQAEFARRVGVHRTKVNLVEHGKHRMTTTKTLVKYAKAANVPPMALWRYLNGEITLESLFPQTTDLDKALTLNDGRWSLATVTAARSLEFEGYRAGSADWVVRLNRLEEVLQGIVSKWKIPGDISQPPA